MQIIIDTSGVHLKKRNKCFYIVSEKQSRMISPFRVSSILVTANIFVGSSAVQLAAEHGIPIFFMDTKGDIYSRLWSIYFGNSAELRRKQVKFCESAEGVAWLINLLKIKSLIQEQNIKYLANRKPSLKNDAQKVLEIIRGQTIAHEELREISIEKSRNRMMGIEGSISRPYWNLISLAMPEFFKFERRSRRPSLDCFNAGLNYAYGMTYSWIERAVVSTGLDPYLGILHTDGYQRPSMVFDMIEPFRPVIDRWWIGLCLKNVPDDSWFRTDANGGVFLEKAGKRNLIPGYQAYLSERKVVSGRMARIQDHMYAFATDLAKLIHQFQK